MTVVRHLLAILLLPFMAVVVVPYGLLGASAAAALPLAWLSRALGAGLFLVGFALFSWCVSLFIRVGRGTLAPWDPTRSLVAAGPYRLVRNPMISGVALMLVGQALLWSSWAMLAWTVFFVLLNHLYFILLEEPGLERRFGANYRTYKATVPRWLPCLGRRVAQ